MGHQGTWAQWRFRPLCQFVGESTWGVAGPSGERHIQIRSMSAHTCTSNVPRKDDQMRQHFRRPACDGTNETVGIWHCWLMRTGLLRAFSLRILLCYIPASMPMGPTSILPSPCFLIMTIRLPNDSFPRHPAAEEQNTETRRELP